MNAEPLDIYLDALDRADADHFPPCCATCRFGEYTMFGDDVIYACKYEIVGIAYLCHPPAYLCDHYEQPRPSDGLDKIY